MNKTEAFLEYQYEEIDVIDEEKEIYLVLDQVSRRIFVKRKLPLSMLEIYKELKSVRHKNLLQVMDVYMVQGTCIVIEEYVEGISLENVLEQTTVLDEPLAMEYTKSLCEALKELHQRNLVHRDVNPNNIRITSNGVLKLMDFDTVKRFQGNPRDTRLLGTVGYAAPEQFGFSESDARTDIYAVGVLLNKMLTGRFPVDGIYTEDKRLEGVIKKCTLLDKKDRYKNVDGILKEFQRSQKGYYLQKFYQQLPGLRSEKKRWKCISFVMYLFFFGGWFGIAQKDFMLDILRQGKVIEYLLVLHTQYVISYMLLFNVGNYTERLWGLCQAPKGVKITVRFILFCMMVVLGHQLELILC